MESTFITTPVYSRPRILSSEIQSTLSNAVSNESHENNTLIWLDEKYDETDPDYQISLSELYRVVNNIHPFIDCDACIDFLTNITDQTKKIILVVVDMFAEEVVPLVADVPQLDAVLVFCNYSCKQDKWAKHHPKVKGVFTEMRALIKCLEQIIDADIFKMVDIIEPLNIDCNRLDSSFMYSQLLKEILLDMHAEGASDRRLFIEYCREHSFEKTTIEMFECNYEKFSPIYWYSAYPFVFETVNTALRTLNIDILLRMTFFIGDLHRQLEQLHSRSSREERLIVYRGQGLTKNECEKLKTSISGLISFNCFLSTSSTRDVSQLYADTNNNARGCTGVLFEIEIDPKIPSSPFASVETFSQYSSENEILFSTHTIFRIDRVIVGDDGLYYVNLSLINNHEKDLCELIDHRRKEIEGRTPLHRLGHLLYRMGKFSKAKEIYGILLGIATHDEILYINHHLARVHCQMGEFGRALSSQAISLQFSDRRNPSLTAAVHAGMGEVFLREDMLETSLEFYEEALQIANRSQAVDDHSKVLYLNNIGLVLTLQKQYDKAQDYFKKALGIALTRFPHTHPDLASLYQNIGSLYFDTGEFYTSIDYQKKSLVIQQLSLPPDHPSLGNIHYNLSQSFDALHQSDEAIRHAQLALDILKKALHDKHPDVRDAQSLLSRISALNR